MIVYVGDLSVVLLANINLVGRVMHYRKRTVRSIVGLSAYPAYVVSFNGGIIGLGSSVTLQAVRDQRVPLLVFPDKDTAITAMVLGVRP